MAHLGWIKVLVKKKNWDATKEKPENLYKNNKALVYSVLFSTLFDPVVGHGDLCINSLTVREVKSKPKPVDPSNLFQNFDKIANGFTVFVFFFFFNWLSDKFKVGLGFFWSISDPKNYYQELELAQLKMD